MTFFKILNCPKGCDNQQLHRNNCSVWALKDTSNLLTVSDDSPEEDVEAEHGEHDEQVAQDAHRIAQLVD